MTVIIMDYKEIGERIRKERQKLGLTQYQLAERINISLQHVGKIERGEKRFSYETIVNISKSLNTTLDYLSFGYDSKEKSPERLELELLTNKLPDNEIPLLNDFVRAMLVHGNREK